MVNKIIDLGLYISSVVSGVLILNGISNGVGILDVLLILIMLFITLYMNMLVKQYAINSITEEAILKALDAVLGTGDNEDEK